MADEQTYRNPTIHRQTRRCYGHDYSARGIYMLTFVVRDRRPILGELMPPGAPSDRAWVKLSPLGEAVAREFENIPAYYPQITIISQQVMPDHWHGLLFVEDTLPNGLDKVISGFKGGCSRAMWALEGKTSEGLFEKGFHDSIVWRSGQLDRYKRYIADNPQRAWIRKTHPDIMRRCLHLKIGERDYAAFGNIFLLRHPDKEAVMCHRWEQEPLANARGTERGARERRAYEETEEYAEARDRWLTAARNRTVLVTPGISKGEQLIKRQCEDEELPLIHLQKEPIGRYWKPEESRFNACAHGRMLILAPWAPESIGDVNGAPASSDYAIFHNLNPLAAEICAFDGEARIEPLANARGTERGTEARGQEPLANARGTERGAEHRAEARIEPLANARGTGRRTEDAYAEYITGKRSYMDITLELRR